MVLLNLSCERYPLTEAATLLLLLSVLSTQLLNSELVYLFHIVVGLCSELLTGVIQPRISLSLSIFFQSTFYYKNKILT